MENHSKNKPALGIFGRRPAPPYERLVRHGVSRYALLGPWHDHGVGGGKGAKVRIPVPLDVQIERAEQLRARGVAVDLLGWPPWSADGLARWIEAMGQWSGALGAGIAWVDWEPIGGLRGRGGQVITSGTHGRMLAGSLRARLPAETRLGVTMVQGPRFEGVEAALDACEVHAIQAYKGAPGPDARRVEQAHRAAPEAECAVAMPAGFGAAETQGELRSYVPGVLAADAPISLVMLWPARHETWISARDWRESSALPAWTWEIYAQYTRGKLYCGPGAP